MNKVTLSVVSMATGALGLVAANAVAGPLGVTVNPNPPFGFPGGNGYGHFPEPGQWPGHPGGPGHGVHGVVVHPGPGPINGVVVNPGR